VKSVFLAFPEWVNFMRLARQTVSIDHVYLPVLGTGRTVCFDTVINTREHFPHAFDEKFDRDAARMKETSTLL
jgi:hypothetical protein